MESLFGDLFAGLERQIAALCCNQVHVSGQVVIGCGGVLRSQLL